jgi:hypothetical protein
MARIKIKIRIRIKIYMIRNVIVSPALLSHIPAPIWQRAEDNIHLI